MKFKYLPKGFYTLYRNTSKYQKHAEEIEKRRKWLSDWELLKSRNISDKEIAKVTGISRATYYRRKKALAIHGYRGLENLSRKPHKFRQSKIPKETTTIISNIRAINPTYSKAKISILLKRDYGIILSDSSVGRILKKTGLIPKFRAKKKGKRRFDQHAKPWQYGFKPKVPGELVQIDHMTVIKNNIRLKHFQAWDPITKTLVAEVYSSATSIVATKFLLKVIQKLPFPLKSIQVDGGSEFMRYFEQFCLKNNIPLFVIPPSRPQYNGGVERANRTIREEFYESSKFLPDSIGAVRFELNKAIDKYNLYRPHFSLKGLTPCEYTSILLNRNSQSHML